MNLGEYISNYRTQHGLSMREFGRMADISVQHISNLEKGINNNGTKSKPTIAILAKIAAATGKTTLELCELLDDVIQINAKEKTPTYSEGFEDVVEMLSNLPADKVDQVRDFVEFLLKKS